MEGGSACKLKGTDGDERRGCKGGFDGEREDDGVVWETTRRKQPEVICVGLGLVSPQKAQVSRPLGLRRELRRSVAGKRHAAPAGRSQEARLSVCGLCGISLRFRTTVAGAQSCQTDRWRIRPSGTRVSSRNYVFFALRSPFARRPESSPNPAKCRLALFFLRRRQTVYRVGYYDNKAVRDSCLGTTRLTRY